MCSSLTLAAYDRAVNAFRRIATLGEAQAVLGWDLAVIMPPAGAPARGDQLATLAGIVHDLLTASRLAEDLAIAEAPGDDPWALRNLMLMRRAQTRAAVVPADLVEARARANAACETVWRVARRDSDFASVAPYLAEVIRLAQETAAHLSAGLDLSPYDALLDGFQPGISTERIETIFTPLAAFLSHALPRAEADQAATDARLGVPRPLPGPFPVAAQAALCRTLAARAGLDFAAARLDTSTHPFCGGIPTDLRLTTRYDEANIAQALMGVLHETGHALYEGGLPRAHARLPVGEAAGMAIHESQSLIIEMQACRSNAYLGALAPILRAAFGGDPACYAATNLARLWRRVERGHIRVEADELTYPGHILLRTQLEQALIAGDLAVADLPAAWNEAARLILGVAPPDDRRGCLQDIHWYDGAFGYFPSYTLGAIAAAQLMQAARREVPEIETSLAEANLEPLVVWLRHHVHARASLLDVDSLLIEATGVPLGAQAFTAHLATRYLND